MQKNSENRIKLVKHNWELPAIISLLASVAGSFSSLISQTNPCYAYSAYAVSLIFGIFAIVEQIESSKAKIVYFNKDNWTKEENALFLEIESDCMLFRVETKNEKGSYQPVISGHECSEDATIMRIHFSLGTPDDELVGRIIIR